MDLFPLYNSIRISLISTFFIFFISIFIANFVVYIPRYLKGIIDVILTMPLVLPPTVIGYLVLRILGPRRVIGSFFIKYFNFRFTMNWWSGIIATMIVIFPLMYRAIRSSFESYDNTYSEIGLDLGANKFKTFCLIKLPICKNGLIAGIVLSFARALGEYGATSMLCGYMPKKTATIATTVYHLWQIDNDKLATFWVIINIIISTIVLFFINFVEKERK